LRNYLWRCHRTLGESYAAAWTAKHSEQALKAEPPDGWPVPPSAAAEASVWRTAADPLNADSAHRRDSADYSRLGIKVEPGTRDAPGGGEAHLLAAAAKLEDYGPNRKGTMAAAAASTVAVHENNNFSLVSEMMIKKEVAASGDYYGGGAGPLSPPPSSRLAAEPRLKSRPATDREIRGGRSSSRYRSTSRDKSPAASYSYARSREGSLDRNRYRSSSREGSREAYRRRSYEGSLADAYRPRSRDISPERDRYRDE
jgi:hypothetical protein